MRITHVIRGEEHLPNAGRQALLYRALGEEEPEFLHLGLILGPDGKKLGKRHGAESVAAYREGGYLPEALLNHLALLGWSHPEGREEFADLGELEKEWDPSRLGASPSAFDPERLLWTNAAHLRRLPVPELRRRLEPFLEGPLPPGREEEAVEALRQDLRTLSEAPALLANITGPVPPEAARGLPPTSEAVFSHAADALRGRELPDLEAAREFVGELRSWAKGEGLKTRELLHPLRLALTGREKGPEMAYLFAVLGPEEARRRIEAARQARLGT
jgi:glutamyl-tRNA synthetase